MSDIVIPGVSSNPNLDTAKMIEELMEVERIPVERMESQVEDYEAQGDAWRSMGRLLSSLRDSSRALYGFESPFRERIASSSNESILTASATRIATDGITEVEVVQVAERDRFASAAVDRDYRVPEGTYTFHVDDDIMRVRFSGGSLENFAETVNRRAGDVVRATVVPNTSTTRVLILESLHEGAENALLFEDDALALAFDMEILASRDDRQLDPLNGETITLEPGDEEQIRLSSRFTVESGMKITYEARIIDIPRDSEEAPDVPPGPTVPEPGSITFEGITVRNESVPLGLPEYEIPEPPPVVESNSVVSLLNSGRTIDLPEVSSASTFTRVELDARDLTSAFDTIVLSNDNTDRRVEIRDLRVYDPAIRGDSVAVNPLGTASDARIRYSGIEIVRPSNTVDDLIPGVTLTLRRAGTEPVEVDVQPDRETIKDSIIEFVGYYNQAIRDINIYTRTEEDILDEIEYFTEDERETYEERLGLFQGDSSLNQLKSRLQVLMMNPYTTSAGSSMQLLAQMGISTNASGPGGGYDAGRLRGYLEINEEELDHALETHFEAISELFGNDTDGDLVMDSGVAVMLDQFTQSYVQTGGIIASRTSSLETRISQTEDRIERYNDRLETYETQLRSDFGRMEGSLQTMQENSSAFDNLGNQGN